MDYSKLVESLKKQEANRKCFDCGVVGTTYASLNFGTFVCSQCAGILRGLNYKVKPLGISIFTLNEYEILHKNGNENAKHIWLALYDPYKHEKPNPKKYNEVKKHLIRKYKEKVFFRESKGINFINKSIEEDIKDPLELINKCKVKNIEIGPLWTRKKEEKNNNEDKNDNKIDNTNKNENKNLNTTNNNVDLLGGLLDIDKNENNNNNKKIDDINDLFGGLNFNNDQKVEKLNNMINNLNNDNPFINNKKETDFGFDFSAFNNNNNNNFQNNNNLNNKEEIKDENFGFDFGDDKPDNINKENNSNNKNENNNLGFNFEQEKNNNEIKSDTHVNLLDFDFNNNNSKQNNFLNNNMNNINQNKEVNLLGFDFENNNMQNKNKIDENLGFDFDSQSQIKKPVEETKDINKENSDNKNNNINLGINFEFENEKKEQNINEPQNINSIFEDPNVEKINNMKKNQEMQRSDNFQSLTIALDNQNQIDKINQGIFDFSLNNNFIQNNKNEYKENNNDFNFDQIMNMPK